MASLDVAARGALSSQCLQEHQRRHQPRVSFASHKALALTPISVPASSTAARKVKGPSRGAALQVSASVAQEATQTGAPAFSAQDRVDVLSKPFPTSSASSARAIVVKYGGAAMKDPTLKEGVIKDLVLLACVGMRPILVHGGGPEINTWLTEDRHRAEASRTGCASRTGLTMEVVEMVLVRKSEQVPGLAH